MEKLYRMKMNENGMPNFSTAEEVEPKHGEWIEVEILPEAYDLKGVKTWASKLKCSKCGFIKTAIEGHIAQYRFCPQCGARMFAKGTNVPNKKGADE